MINFILLEDKMTKEIKEIKELAEQFSETLDDNANTDIQVEEFGACTTYNSLEDLEDFLFTLGKKIDCKILTTAFKKPLQLKEIISTIDIDNLWDFEELKEEETNSEIYDNDDKYIWDTIIFKYIPSNIFISVLLQKSKVGDVNLNVEYQGEVTKEEVTTTQWV